MEKNLSPKTSQQRVLRFEPRVAEALVTIAQIDEIEDGVLDFLSKHCIINKSRIPVYQDAFCTALKHSQYDIWTKYHSETNSQETGVFPGFYENVITEKSISEDQKKDPDSNLNTGPYSNVTEDTTPVENVKMEENSEFKNHSANLPSPENLISRSQSHLTREEFEHFKKLSELKQLPDLIIHTKTAAQEYVDRLDCSVRVLVNKEEKLNKDVEYLQAQKFCFVVDLALVKYSNTFAKYNIDRYNELVAASYTKLQNRSKSHILPQHEVKVALRDEPIVSSKDSSIYRLISSKLHNELSTQSPIIQNLDLKIVRTTEKLAETEKHLEELLSERSMARVYCETVDSKESLFPTASKNNSDIQVQNITISGEDLFPSLHRINDNLITADELNYISHLLELPGRQTLTFRMFCVIAALSEKVINAEAFARRLIERVDCEALLTKLDICKKLFLMVHNGEYIPERNVTSNALTVDLIAGGFDRRCIIQVVRKLTSTTPGMIDFLDFLIYLPLFIEVHTRIVTNPLNK